MSRYSSESNSEGSKFIMIACTLRLGAGSSVSHGQLNLRFATRAECTAEQRRMGAGSAGGTESASVLMLG